MQIAIIARCMASVAYTSLNIMSMDIPKGVCFCSNKFLKNLFPECKKIEDFFTGHVQILQLFTVLDLSEVK